MATETVNSPSQVATWTKVLLGISSAVAFLLGAFAILASLNQNEGCESYSGCVPDDEATAVLWVAIGVALALFVAGGIGIASCRDVPRYRLQLTTGLILGVIGGLCWVVWMLMLFAAGIRATT